MTWFTKPHQEHNVKHKWAEKDSLPTFFTRVPRILVHTMYAIHNDGSAIAQIGGDRLAFPSGTIDTTTLRRLLNAIGNVSRIPTETRMKSASFGTRTQIEYAAKTSGDLQSVPQRTSDTDSEQMQASRELRKFVQAVLSQLKIGTRVVVVASAIGR
jgi:hypothetical protein